MDDWMDKISTWGWKKSDLGGFFARFVCFHEEQFMKPFSQRPLLEVGSQSDRSSHFVQSTRPSKNPFFVMSFCGHDWFASRVGRG